MNQSQRRLFLIRIIWLLLLIFAIPAQAAQRIIIGGPSFPFNPPTSSTSHVIYTYHSKMRSTGWAFCGHANAKIAGLYGETAIVGGVTIRDRSGFLVKETGTTFSANALTCEWAASTVEYDCDYLINSVTGVSGFVTDSGYCDANVTIEEAVDTISSWEPTLSLVTTVTTGTGANGGTWTLTIRRPVSTPLEPFLKSTFCHPSGCPLLGWFTQSSGYSAFYEIELKLDPGVSPPPISLPDDAVIITPDYTQQGDIAAGFNHSLAVKGDGTVRAWGLNSSGQLGINSTTSSSVPVLIPNLSQIIAVAAGGSHSLALWTNGTVKSWGSDAHGQLGNGSGVVNSLVPVTVQGLTDVVAIAAGMNSSYALKADGSVWSWGQNNSGQLGIGSTVSQHLPVKITSISGIVSISAGNLSAYALTASGTIKSWGANGSGQLGDGTTTIRLSPVNVFGITTAKAISAGGAHCLAVLANGHVRNWGNNSNAELGNYSYSNSAYPVAPYIFDGYQNNVLTGIVSVSGGFFHSHATTSSGIVYSWGANNTGQLGVQSYAATINYPTPIYNMYGWGSPKKVVGGGRHAIGLKADGTVWGWGYNAWGQVGDNSSVNRYYPVSSSGLDLW